MYVVKIVVVSWASARPKNKTLATLFRVSSADHSHVPQLWYSKVPERWTLNQYQNTHSNKTFAKMGLNIIHFRLPVFNEHYSLGEDVNQGAE